MTTTSPFELDDTSASIARRAVDLARDNSSSPDDVTEHLQRLARGHRGALEGALDQLERSDQTADVQCAQMLLTTALDLLPPRT